MAPGVSTRTLRWTDFAHGVRAAGRPPTRLPQKVTVRRIATRPISAGLPRTFTFEVDLEPSRDQGIATGQPALPVSRTR